MPVPKTILGKWSVGFSIAFIVLLALSLILAVSIQPVPIQQGDETVVIMGPLFPLLNVFGATLTLSGFLSFIIGIFSVIKRKERSVLVYLAIGLPPFSFVLGEILFPH